MGREEQLAQLHRSLQQNHRVALTAVAGMGGVGKTELAVQYARRHEAEYPGGVCWLLAREKNLDALAAELLSQVKEQGQELPDLPLDKQVRWCWENWQPEGRVLIVLDDVTELSDYQQFLPMLSRFCVVVTTRVRSIDASFADLPLDVLPDEQALELLRNVLQDNGRIDREPEAAKQLCKALGNLPLGLELVGRYLRKRRTFSLAEMLKRLQLEAEALERDPKYYMTAQRGVKAAFDLTWQELDAAAQKVALLLSWFAPDAIPWFLVERMMQRVEGEDYSLIEPTTELDNAFLIQPGEEGLHKLHPLIREFFQVKRQTVGQLEPYQQAFIDVLAAGAKQMPQDPTRKDIEAFTVVQPHLEVVAQAMTDRLSDEDLSWPFVGLARFYQGQGLYALAEPWYQQCLSTTESRFGEEHPDVATSLNNLAALYRSQGRYSEAEPLLVQALALHRQLLIEEHPDVATSLNNLAELYRSQRRYGEAEPLLVQALALHRQLLSEEHPDVAMSLNNLALLYSSQGRYSEAEPLLVRALALHRQLLGEEHPDVALSLNNLALLYSSQGRYSEAEPLLVRALALHRQLLGEEHPDVATSLNNLATLYRSQRRYAEAEPLLVRALTLHRQPLGEEHPDVATSLNNLATLYYLRGRYAEAEPLYLQALRIAEARSGVDHPNTMIFRRNLESLRQRMQSDRSSP